ncbi:PepSY domain-containing protein (plasmid) [Pseudoalteromonas sp. KG3]|uniref:PepSY domain-containing protein n=1 Tax=Pseudoalteromonas prydzensis TaxID=182141 RepID=A0ABR9FS55_9GAMM|nr:MULTISPECIES: PepSY domain-containing protein [Pseudoalteromonas]MBE0459666.1 PepSY domain-containing protein [Pseudoalteromonas prydzensis]WKD26468.1 PepSY domain-containing protein [Pseudoalteromonas sp. KG3]
MNNSKNTYRILWRWHFYAGLFCIPFLIILSISGAIYLFTPQIEHMREADYVANSTSATRTLPAQQVEKAMGAVPGGQFQSYRLPQNNQDAIRVSVLKNNQRYLVYVDPYTLDVMDVVAWDSRFIEWVKDLHGNLLAGNNGSLLVELAACWSIFLVLTGLYLWWPIESKGMAGVFYPRIRQGGRRFWRDLHAVIGMWSSLLVLFLLITGLPWTQVWGSGFKELRKSATQMTSTDWTSNKKQELQTWRLQSNGYISLSEKAYQQAMALDFAAPAELSVSDETQQVWKLTSQAQNRPLRQNAWLDNYTGEVVKRNGFGDKALLDRVIGVGIAAHEGQLFGWANQLLGVIVALALLIMSVSGFVLWRKRKPPGRLGTPPKLQQQKLSKSKGVIVLMLLLAALMPMLLISLIIILVLETWLFPKLPKVQAFLGLTN